MEKYLKALSVLTAVSEQTKAMAHLYADDTTRTRTAKAQRRCKV